MGSKALPFDWIVQVLPSRAGYGGDRVVRGIHSCHRELGLNSMLVYLSEPKGDGEDEIGMELKSPYSPLSILRLERYLRSLKGNGVLHAHMTPSIIACSFLSRVGKGKWISCATEHSPYNRRRTLPLGRFLDRRLYGRFDKLIMISEGVQKSFIEWQPELESKCVVAENGVKLRRKTFEVSGKKGKVPVIISVGRLQPMKNYETILRALASIQDLPWEYRILGDGASRQSLEELIRDLGLKDRVKLLGFQEDVYRWLLEADIFLHAPLYEGFGLAVVEAMECGLPVISSRVSGLHEVVDCARRCAVEVDPTDTAAIALGVRTLLDNPGIREEMGRAAFERSRVFDIKKTAKAYCDVYSSVFLNFHDNRN